MSFSYWNLKLDFKTFIKNLQNNYNFMGNRDKHNNNNLSALQKK